MSKCGDLIRFVKLGYCLSAALAISVTFFSVCVDAVAAGRDTANESFAVSADGAVLRKYDVQKHASGIFVGDVAYLSNCFPELAKPYRDKYLAQAKRLYPQFAAETEARYDQFFELKMKEQDARFCTQGGSFFEEMVETSRGRADAVIAQLEGAQLHTKESIRVAKQEELKARGNFYNKELADSIRGEPSEIDTLGTGLRGLEAGVIWYGKYFFTNIETADSQFWRNVQRFKAMRLKLLETIENDLDPLIQQAGSSAELAVIKRRYLNLRMDRDKYAGMALLAKIETRKYGFEGEESYKGVVERNKGKNPAFGFGEPELMEAIVNSRVRALRLQRKVSGNTVLFMNPLMSSQVMILTKVEKGTVHLCKPVDEAATSLNCTYSVHVLNIPKGILDSSSARKNPLLNFMLSLQKDQSIDQASAVFIKDASGWYSPTFVEGLHEGLRDLQDAWR